MKYYLNEIREKLTGDHNCRLQNREIFGRTHFSDFALYFLSVFLGPNDQTWFMKCRMKRLLETNGNFEGCNFPNEGHFLGAWPMVVINNCTIFLKYEYWKIWNEKKKRKKKKNWLLATCFEISNDATKEIEIGKKKGTNSGMKLLLIMLIQILKSGTFISLKR